MPRPATAFIAALLIVTAGCVGFDAATPTSPVSSTPGTTTIVGITPAIAVTVTDVVDGDTLGIRYRNGSTDTIRLLGIDTPEVDAENEPGEYEGVPDTAAGADCLRGAGRNASAYVRERLLGRTVGVAFDPRADRRGDYGRLLAYVYAGDRTVNYRLVVEGHARVFDGPFTAAERFYEAESRAQGAGRGLWRCRALGTTTGTDDA